MIQRYIKDQLASLYPNMEWTVDYETSDGDYGVVYYDGGDQPDRSDRQSRYLNYQVVIKLSNFREAERIAFGIFEAINGQKDIQLEHFDRPIFVQYIYAETEPMRIGVYDDRMIYTINFNALVYPDCRI